MIKYFTVENYGSIRDENILEFDANLGKGFYLPAHPTIGFAGANGSGKTTILQSLTFVLWFMQRSFLELEEDREIPYAPFLTLPDPPTKFHLIFARKNAEQEFIDYEYELTIKRSHVISEKLYHSQKKESNLVYNRSENEVEFGKNITSIVIKDLRPNCSVISFATQFESQEVARDCKNHLLISNLSPFSPFSKATLLSKQAWIQKYLINVLNKDEISKEKIVDSIKIADIGIKDMIKQISTEEIIKFLHGLGDTIEELGFDLESAGTTQFLAVLLNVLRVLEEGAILIADEIELRLHPSLVAYLIGLFQNPQENPKGAQLIFSFHNSYFMEILEPEQLWFAEKNDQGQTELFSAAAFTDIKDLYQKDLELLYRAGRFGAKPRGL